MSLDGLRQYGSDYGGSSDDDRRDEVPNSSSGDDANDNADPDSADDRAVKKIRAEDLYSSDDCNQSDSSSLHTPAQKSKRAFTPPRFQKDYLVPPSDSDTQDRDRDDLFFGSSPRRKRGFKRIRSQWDNVMSWSLLHVSQDDINGEIARIMAKSMEDANISVTPKHNSRAVSHFRQKTVSHSSSNLFSNIFGVTIFSNIFGVTVVPFKGRSRRYHAIYLSIFSSMRLPRQV